MRIYGEQSCKRCGKNPILTIVDRDAPPERCRYVYKPKYGKRAEPELWNVFFPTFPDPLGLCWYCKKVALGLFSIVPIVDVVRKIGEGKLLTPKEQSRYAKFLTTQAEDEVWHR